MTHTLHREGSIESLKKDYVVFVMPAQGYNVEGSGEKLQRFLRLAKQFNPVNIGDNRATGSLAAYPYDLIADSVRDGSIVHVVFDNPEAVVKFLRVLKQEDMGISVIVSGLMDAVGECCKEAGLKRHTVNLSLGIHGKTEKLAPDNAREVTTMCGHGMITGAMVLDMVDRIKAGRTTPEKASQELCKLCICGVFNPARSAELLAAMAKAD